MIKTRKGWHRVSPKQRAKQRSLTQQLAPSFTCHCNQCYCGGFTTVELQGIPCCRSCGQPQELPRIEYGRFVHVGYVGLTHSPLCSLRQA